jgi:hypothetical protein
LASDGRILVQKSMRSDAIIIVGVGFQDPTQIDLAEDNDVVQTLTPDRPDQLFGKAVLPRRGWCVQIDTVSSPEMPGFFGRFFGRATSWISHRALEDESFPTEREW